MSTTYETHIARLFTLLGYSHEQSLVYLDLLVNGPSTLKRIAERTKIPRSSLYDYYPPLMFDGLLSQTSSQGKKQLVAESPDRLHQLWQTKLHTYQQADQQLKNLIPELKLMYQTNQHRPIVKYYVGMAGIQSALSLSLSSRTDICSSCLGDPQKDEASLEDDPIWYQEFNAQLQKKKIIMRDILERTKANLEFQALYQSSFHQIKIVDPKRTAPTAHVDTFIWDDYVMTVDFTHQLGLLIQDAHLANNERLMFNLLWDALTD